MEKFAGGWKGKIEREFTLPIKWNILQKKSENEIKMGNGGRKG